MTAFNIVRMRVKPGHEKDYIDFHRARRIEEMPGMQAFTVVRTGPRDFCVIGQWRDLEALAAARSKMIGMLDEFRDILEDLGHGLGVTDPVSGEAVVEVRGQAVSPQPAA
jgi:quinol monooxygenase YgiN